MKNYNESQLRVSIVTPMYNESELVESCTAKLLGLMKSLPWEVETIVVNDGSTDDTKAKLLPLVEQNENLRIVSYERNRGRGYAIRAGVKEAMGDVIVVTEGDLSWGEEIVEQLTRALVDGSYDCIVASPHAPGGSMQRVPAFRVALAHIGNKVLRVLMPIRLSNYTGMTRSYRRKVIKSLDLDCDGKELHLEIIAKLGAQGCAIGEIPATLTWPDQRVRRGSGGVPWRYIVSHLLFGFGEAPLLLLGGLGTAFIGLGSILGVYLFAVSFLGTPVGGRPLLLFSVVCILVGFFLIILGLKCPEFGGQRILLVRYSVL